MAKNRLFYLDFVRAIATISILLTHFNALYLYMNPQMPEKAVITTEVANIYIGSFGVSLFFIISGAALMYVYQNKDDLKSYFKKRFLSIYPMFWIAYAVVFVLYLAMGVPILQQAEPWKFIFTIIGFDGYLLENTRTFYILGEWFLGCIILMYLVFPIIKKGVQKYPKMTAVILLAAGIGSAYFNPTGFPTGKMLLTRLPEFALGMYFIKYIKSVNLPTFIISAVVLILNTVLKPEINVHIQTMYVGAASFFVLVYISRFFTFEASQKACATISKYSYAIFLVHHVIIAMLSGYFNLYTISIKESYLLFFVCCCVITVSSWGLFKVDESVRWIFQKVKDRLCRQPSVKTD